MLRKDHPVLPQSHLGSGLAIAVLGAANTIVEHTCDHRSRFGEHDCALNYHHLQRSFVATSY